MISTSELYRSYGEAPHEIAAIRAVSFELEHRQQAVIIGKSGSGKSTLLNLLAALDRPTRGALTVDSNRLDQLSRNEMARYRLRTVGMVFQSFQLIPQRTALQNVELPLILEGQTAAERRRQASAMLDQVGLQDRANHLPYQLSGGEQQRVAIARALINKPRVFLADEPTGNLDTSTAREVLSLLEELFDRHKTTVVFVTHDQQIASRIGNRRFLMSDGCLQEVGADFGGDHARA